MLDKLVPITHAANINIGDGLSGPGSFRKNVKGDSLGSFVSIIITTLTVVGGLAFVIYFIMAGIKWITAGGDKNSTQQAKDQMVHAAMGLIVIVASYFIIGIIGGVLGLDILNPFSTILKGVTP